ncbi:hypothetical protein MASSI9I_70045 [Massilia sp. 9I]|nr:hypothetical protein MASSI9I_70045 [Massilia sp. 9I]
MSFMLLLQSLCAWGAVACGLAPPWLYMDGGVPSEFRVRPGHPGRDNPLLKHALGSGSPAAHVRVQHCYDRS